MEQTIGELGLLIVGIGVMQTGIEDFIKIMVIMMDIMLWIMFEGMDG